jgi:hypothetical protein
MVISITKIDLNIFVYAAICIIVMEAGANGVTHF